MNLREKLSSIGHYLFLATLACLSLWAMAGSLFGGCSFADQGHEQEYRQQLQYDEGYEDGFDEGYYEGYADGEDSGRDEGYEDGYREGSQYGWKDNIHETADHFAGGAVDFAIEHSGMHPEDAAAIIENGGSKSEYEAAAQCLYYYFMYFYNCEYSR